MIRSNQITLVDSLVVPFGLVEDESNSFLDISKYQIAYFDHVKSDYIKAGDVRMFVGYIYLTFDTTLRQHQR